MMNIIIQLVMAGIGAVAFGLFYNVNKRYLFIIFCLGTFCWGSWLFTKIMVTESIFVAALQTGLLVAIAAEIVSRIMRAPSTIFFLTASIPIVPGGQLYRFMTAIVEKNRGDTVLYGLQALYIAFGIAVGMSIAWAICDFCRKISRNIKKERI